MTVITGSGEWKIAVESKISVQNSKFQQIEEYPCCNVHEATLRERYWYEELNSNLNNNVPSRTRKESSQSYYQSNTETLKQKHKEYNQTNRELISQKRKEYRQANKESIKQYKKKYDLRKKLEKLELERESTTEIQTTTTDAVPKSVFYHTSDGTDTGIV